MTNDQRSTIQNAIEEAVYRIGFIEDKEVADWVMKNKFATFPQDVQDALLRAGVVSTLCHEAEEGLLERSCDCPPQPYEFTLMGRMRQALWAAMDDATMVLDGDYLSEKALADRVAANRFAPFPEDIKAALIDKGSISTLLGVAETVLDNREWVAAHE